MKFSRAFLGLAGVVFLGGAAFLIACGGDDNSGSTPTATRAPASQNTGAREMIMADNSFNPATLTATVGQAVLLNLTNAGAMQHTFTIDGLADSGILAAGAKAPLQFTATQAGTLTYYCKVHGAALMSGRVTVTAGASAPAVEDLPSAVAGDNSAPEDSDF